MTDIFECIGREGWHNFLWKPIAHFVSSGLVGLVVYWLISTILTRWYSRQPFTLTLARVEFSIRSFSLLFAVCSGLFVHMLVDYTFNWF